MKLVYLLVLMCVFSSLRAKQLALLIGNSDYENCPKLDNPVNDVSLVSKRFTEGGYDVTTLKNASLVEMTKGLARFSEKAKGAEKVVFFYAGHGIEVDGSNYIIPVGARLEKKGDQKWEALSLTNVLTELEVAKVKVIVLDCCRDDPFGATRSWRRTRSASKGGMAALHTNQLSRGSMVVYSGKPGQTVPDGAKGGNSPFTKAWNKELLRAQGKSIMAVFSDMGDFLPSENKHWVKIDSDGESLALLNRTQLLNELSEDETMEEVPQGEVVPVPPQFVHHRLDRDTLIYSGDYEGDEAYFALSWHSSSKFTGYCFLHEGGTLYYLNGELVAPAKMEMSLWHQGRKVRFARLDQVKHLGAESWEGKTNLGAVSFSKEKSNKKNASMKADYIGSLGVEDAKLSLHWTTVEKVAGRLELDKGRVLKLVADNSLKGTMFINVYGANGHQAVAILKRSSFNGVSWSGQLHFNDGHKELLSVRR